MLPEVKENNRQKRPLGSLQQQPIVQLEKISDLEKISKFGEGDDGTNFEAIKVELEKSVPVNEDVGKPNKPMVRQTGPKHFKNQKLQFSNFFTA